MNNTVINTKVITGKVRFSYAYVWEPKSIDGGDERYSVSLIIPKKDKKTIDTIQKAIEAAKTAGISKFGGKIPSNLKMPLRDGDTERDEDENYSNSYFLNATCKTKPGIVDRHCQPIIDPTEFYSGCYGHASITFYAFNNNGNKGIACGLNHVMKTEDGEPLGGRAKAEDDFKSLMDSFDDDDDFLS